MTSATPFLMFAGTAQAAMDLYVSLFPDSRIVRADRYAPNELGPAGSIKARIFTLCGREFMCCDSPVKQAFPFTPANSIFVECETADLLERVFSTLAVEGKILMPLNNYGFSQRFAWLNDRFGVSWQINLAG